MTKLVIFYDNNNINIDTKSYINALEKRAKVYIEKGKLLQVCLVDVNIYQGYSFVQIIQDCTGFVVAEPIKENIKKGLRKTIIDLNMEYKDLDGFLNPHNRCTVTATITSLTSKTSLVEKDICVIGRNLGKYIANALIDLHSTVQVCNSRTKELECKMKSANVIICCASYGKTLINTIKNFEDKIIVDVGNNVNKHMHSLNNVISYKTIGRLNTQILFDRLLKEQ